MLVTYPFDVTALNQTPGLGSQNNQKNKVIGATLGDTVFRVEPTDRKMVDNTTPLTFECPCKVLRGGTAVGTGLVPTNTGRGPHQDYLFMQDSVEYTYTTRALITGGVVEKQMPVGAQVGQEGRMILYKGATSVANAGPDGDWTERLVRPFLITAADIANRESSQPASGAVPTVDPTTMSVVDNSGDGYNHV